MALHNALLQPFTMTRPIIHRQTTRFINSNDQLKDIFTNHRKTLKLTWYIWFIRSNLTEVLETYIYRHIVRAYITIIMLIQVTAHSCHFSCIYETQHIYLFYWVIQTYGFLHVYCSFPLSTDLIKNAEQSTTPHKYVNQTSIIWW